MDNFAGENLANNNRNQAEATTIKIEEEASMTKPKWRLCSYCGVPGHPIGKCPMVPCRRCHTVGHARNKCPLSPCKYCKMTGQHAIGQCPVVLAKTARSEHLRNNKIAARAARAAAATATAATKKRKQRTQEQLQQQQETSILLKSPLADDDKEEEYANEFASINASQRGLAKDISMQSPICDQPSRKRTRTRKPQTNLSVADNYSDATAHL